MSDQRRTWRIERARTVFDNRWIRVRSYDAIAPTGAPAHYGLIQFKNLAIGVLPIDEQGCTILVGQERFAFGRYSWELPEGGGPLDAPPLQSAIRELSEETRLKAASWLEILADAHLSNSVSDERAYAYIAWGLSPDDAFAPDESEDLTLRRVPFTEAVGMAASGEITDAFTLVILLKADHLLRTGKLAPELSHLMLGGGR